jgi:opacity protein-like surface antigen
MLRKIIIISGFLIACVYANFVSAATYDSYQEKGPTGFWAIKGGAGYSIPAKFLNQTSLVNANPLNPSDPSFNGTNILTQKRQSTLPLFYLGLQKSFILDIPFVYSLSIGPSFYYQQSKSSGSGILTSQPNRTNFDYTFNNQQLLMMLELQWTPVLLWNHFAPYLMLGGGMNTHNMAFTATPLSTYTQPMPSNTTQRQWGFSVDVGLGAEILLGQHWGFDLRYVYFKNFNNTLSGVSVNGPVPYTNSSHNFLLSVIYRFGFSES